MPYASIPGFRVPGLKLLVVTIWFYTVASGHNLPRGDTVKCDPIGHKERSIHSAHCSPWSDPCLSFLNCWFYLLPRWLHDWSWCSWCCWH